MNTSDRGSFGSRLGIVLATAGSAVGLGNVWRFPYMAGENGGAAFIVVYICCILVIGIPGMLGEFIVGRRGASNAAQAYGQFVGKPRWRAVGVLGIFTSTIILGFYAVVAGWCLQYLFASLLGHINGDTAYVQRYFAEFSSDAFKPIGWALAFILLTHVVVARGVRNGIERVSKILMPLLFVLLLVIVAASCSLPGSWRGVEFLLKPDFSKVDADVLLDAMGQAFFSLSLGTACLCTYASYFGRETNLLRSAGQIAVIDTLVAILSGLMIFPAAFSVGVEPDSGPKLIFITLPAVFHDAFAAMPGVGYVVSILFYTLLTFAALTSTISMHEIGTAFFHEEKSLGRGKAAWIVTSLAAVIAVLSSLSMGAAPGLQLFGLPLLNFFDFLTSQILLPLGAFATFILVGWVASRQMIRDEFTNGGTLPGRLFSAYIFLARYVCPVGIALIFLHELGII